MDKKEIHEQYFLSLIRDSRQKPGEILFLFKSDVTIYCRTMGQENGRVVFALNSCALNICLLNRYGICTVYCTVIEYRVAEPKCVAIYSIENIVSLRNAD
jgi:hypothetical protein